MMTTRTRTRMRTRTRTRTMTMTIKMTMSMMTMKMIKMMMRMMTIDMILSMMMMTTTTTMIAVNSRISSFTTKQHMPNWDTCKQRGQYFRVLAGRQLRLGSGWIAASSCAHGEASGRTMIGLDLHSVTFQALLCWEFSLFQIPSKLELSNLHPVSLSLQCLGLPFLPVLQYIAFLNGDSWMQLSSCS